MPVEEKAREALDLKNLKLPRNTPVERLEVEDYMDSTGVPSLRILAVLKESTDLDAMTGRDVGDMKRAIFNRLLERGIDRFPYISIALPSELEETDDEEE